MPRRDKREWKPEDLPREGQEILSALDAGEEPSETSRPTFGRARGLVTLADDFDAPLEDFRDYT